MTLSRWWVFSRFWLYSSLFRLRSVAAASTAQSVRRRPSACPKLGGGSIRLINPVYVRPAHRPDIGSPNTCLNFSAIHRTSSSVRSVRCSFATFGIGAAVILATTEYIGRHITRNRPAISTVIVVSVQRLLNDIHIAGLASYTDRDSPMIAARGSALVSGNPLG